MSQENMVAASTSPYFAEALHHGFPRFLGDIADSNPLNAAPYVCTYGALRNELGTWPGRKNFLDHLSDILNKARHIGLLVDVILLAGSIIDANNETPKDLDCVIFYKYAEQGALINVRAVADLQNAARRLGVDARFVPIDADPVLFVKAVSYFTILYTASKQGQKAALGPLLIDCR